MTRNHRLPNNIGKVRPAIQACKTFNSVDYQSLAVFCMAAVAAMQDEEGLVNIVNEGTNLLNQVAMERQEEAPKISVVN